MSQKTRLDTQLARAVVNGDMPNAVCAIGSREGTLYEGAFGARTLGGSTPMTPDTVVWLASMTKAITTTGVMQLVPDHTRLAEIFDEVPRIECNGSETDRNYGLERMLPDPECAANLLDYYYANRDILK